MKSFCALLLTLAIYQASAKPEPNQSFNSNGFSNLNNINSGYESSLPATHIQTAIVENPTVNFPSYIPPASISQSCHYMRTLVRPQIRNEIISVPSVDRIVRTVSTPLVETINCGGGSRLATFTHANGILSGTGGTQSLSDAMQQCNNHGNSARSTKIFFTEANSGRGFSATQNTKGVTSGMNGVNVGLIGRPSIITFQTSNGGNSQGYTNIISGSTAFSNAAKTMGSNLHVILK